MARFHIAAALAIATVALLLILQLLSTFGWPKIEFLGLSYDNDITGSVHNQFPISGQASVPEASATHGARYLLGVGKGDITGPVVEINMMGYADPAQVGSGLRQRLYSRAFIIGDVHKLEDRFVYLVLDTQSGDTAVRHGILEGLAKMGKEYDVYGQKNVAVTGTHSHSGPGAWLNYLLPQITSKGFDQQSYQAIVDGALLSIQRAHRSLKAGHLDVGYVEIEDANINRSLFAYLANPAKERKGYKHSVDKTLTMLKFWNAENGKSMGVLTWFPVHGTSMLGNNTLITGDNKGVAAQFLEQAIQGTEGADDGFVAGFSQANVGDTSPNVLGAYCEDGSGKECDFEDSTCGGKNEPCHGQGPNFRVKDQGASSCYEIGKRQAVAAHSLYDLMIKGGLVRTPVRGSTVKAFHSFHDFSSFYFQHPNGSIVSTCPAALGYSFAAGTTDGPGAFDFKQNNTGSPNANPVWSVVRGFLREPSEEQIACHHSKPILLDVGEIENPYLWTPNIVDVQMFRVGQLIIIVSPGEATTMAGRRWKKAIHSSAEASTLTDGVEPIVVLGGPANSYTHYIATEEEYGIQRYEGASTLYGPHTLNAHIEITRSYLRHLGPESTSNPPPGPEPPIYVNESMSFITGVAFDRAPFFKSFGDVISDVETSYPRGSIAMASFVGANPRNDLRLEDTYASVEKRDDDGKWVRIRDDADWSLIFKWKRTNSVLATSEVEIIWEIEDEAEHGKYRIKYFGASKTPISGEIVQFEGVSAVFDIV